MPCAYRHEGLSVPQHLGNKCIGQMGFGQVDSGLTRDNIGCDHDRATNGRSLLITNGLELFLRIAPNQLRPRPRPLPLEDHMYQIR